MSDGKRPHFYIDHILDGAVGKVAQKNDLTKGDAYILGAELLVYLDPEVDYAPDDPNLDAFLERTGLDEYAEKEPSDGE